MDFILAILTAAYDRLAYFSSSFSEWCNEPVTVRHLLIAGLVIWSATKIGTMDVLREIKRVKETVDQVRYKIHHPYEPSEWR